MNNNIIVLTSLLIVPIVETRLLNISESRSGSGRASLESCRWKQHALLKRTAYQSHVIGMEKPTRAS